MTVYTEKTPENEMALDMTAQDVARAIEYYMNGVMFKRPITVLAVEKLSTAAHHGGNQFRIKFKPEIDRALEPEAYVDVEVAPEEL